MNESASPHREDRRHVYESDPGDPPRQSTDSLLLPIRRYNALLLSGLSEYRCKQPCCRDAAGGGEPGERGCGCEVAGRAAAACNRSPSLL